MSHTVTTFADLMPAQAAPVFVLYLSHSIHVFDTQAELLSLADLLCSAYVVELYDDGTVTVTDMPPLPDVALGVYPLPLAA